MPSRCALITRSAIDVMVGLALGLALIQFSTLKLFQAVPPRAASPPQPILSSSSPFPAHRAAASLPAAFPPPAPCLPSALCVGPGQSCDPAGSPSPETSQPKP